jgi:ribosomal protein S27E
LQASKGREVLGRGRIESFFAPYRCSGCDHQQERLLSTATIFACDSPPPAFACPNCARVSALDDLPERYLAFLAA